MGKPLTIELVELDSIRIDGDTQPREAICEETVAEYAETLAAGGDLPPLDVVRDGVNLWLWDGFHRWHAHRRIGNDRVPVVARSGTLDDARWWCLSANAVHGLRRTNADKRRAVELALAMRPDLSDRAIAEHCGVSHTFVQNMRDQLSGNGCQMQARTVTRGGTTYTQDTSNIGKRPGPTGNGQQATEQETQAVLDQWQDAPVGTTVEVVLPPREALRDEVGLPVPEALASVFEARESFDELVRALRLVQQRIGELADEPAGARLAEDLAYKHGSSQGREVLKGYSVHLQNAISQLTWGRPYVSICPYCHREGGKPRRACKACGGADWVTRRAWEGCPEVDREAARLDRLEEAGELTPEGEA